MCLSFPFIAAVQASAQSRDLMSPQLTAPMPLTPGTGSPGATLVPMAPDPPIRSAARAVVADGSGRAGGARGLRPLWPRRAGDQRRPHLARLCREAGRHRDVPPDQRGQSGGADLRAAAGQLRRPCQPRARQRGQGGATARRDRSRSFRNSRRRHPARGPRRRCPHPHRADFVRHLSPAANSTPPSAGRSRRTS